MAVVGGVDVDGVEHTHHEVAREEPVGRAARAHQVDALPAQLVVGAQQVVEQVPVVLQEADLGGRHRGRVEEAEIRESRERVGGIGRRDQRLERLVDRGERRRGGSATRWRGRWRKAKSTSCDVAGPEFGTSKRGSRRSGRVSRRQGGLEVAR